MTLYTHSLRRVWPLCQTVPAYQPQGGTPVVHRWCSRQSEHCALTPCRVPGPAWSRSGAGAAAHRPPGGSSLPHSSRPAASHGYTPPHRHPLDSGPASDGRISVARGKPGQLRSQRTLPKGMREWVAENEVAGRSQAWGLSPLSPGACFRTPEHCLALV